MSSLNLRLPDDRTRFEPHERIEIDASWHLAEVAEAVELRLTWHTVGRGAPEAEIEHVERFDDPNLIDSRRVTLTLPEGPYSFSGKLVSLLWAVELVVLPSGESICVPVTLAPHGREIELHGWAPEQGESLGRGL